MKDIYKMATRENWTFPTSKGTVSVHDLWQLPLDSEKYVSLNSVAINLHDSLSSTTGKSFVKRKSPADTLISRKLELVQDIIATREEEAAAKLSAKQAESHNAKIDELISKKVDQELAGLSIEQLQALKK